MGLLFQFEGEGDFTFIVAMRSFISGILSLHLLWNYLDDKSVFKKLETCELARETTRNPLNKQFNTLNGEKYVFTAFPKTAKAETNTLNI